MSIVGKLIEFLLDVLVKINRVISIHGGLNISGLFFISSSHIF